MNIQQQSCYKHKFIAHNDTVYNSNTKYWREVSKLIQAHFCSKTNTTKSLKLG